jgi:tetratricopeptide (TPR) repeat protein
MSTAAADLELMRASVRMDSDPAAAARAASAILGRYPGHEGAALLLATACRRIGDAATSLAVLRPLATEHADSAALQLELGRALVAAGEDGPARAALERALALDEGFADAWQELAAIHFRAGDELAGDAAYLRYTAIVTAPPELADARSALAENRLDTAESLLTAHLGRAPQDVVALRVLADAVARRGDYGLAEQRLKECLALAPGYAAARFDLARVLNAVQRSDEALAQLDRLLASAPANRTYRVLRAQVLRLVGRNDEAIALMEQVVAENASDVVSLVVFGHLLREVGEQARAIETYRQALAVQPGSGDVWWSLANLKTFRFTADEEQVLRAQVARSPELGVGRVRLEFALGKALEDSGQYAESFEHYERANDLQRGALDYDSEAVTADVRRSEAMYTPRFFAERAGWGLDRRDPIFVVGVPRSGSTLLEQILASHPQIEGTRELPDMAAIANELAVRSRVGGHSTYPQVIGTLRREDVEQLAARYLAQTQVHRPLGRPRFVDKMLGNFGHVGLIHLMFPRATIIDARRHPLGSGFSCYKQLFPRGMTFAYNQTEMGRYWRDYHELMAHFDAVLPGRVHRVHYEAMVADPEREVRRLLEHCGLPFDERCLRFYETTRTVMTVSSEQVRRPIYAGGVDQWRHYELWLDPLAQALGSLATDYPTFGVRDG